MFAIQVPISEKDWIYVLDLFEVDKNGEHKPTLYLTKKEAEKEASNAGWTSYRIVEYNGER
jgi:hypothetical protein